MIVYDIRKYKPSVTQPASPESRTPSFQGEVFLIDDFQGENTNRLGGYFGDFFMSPSESRVTLEKVHDDLSFLSFSYHQKHSGYAGFWIHLFDFKQPPAQRIFFDSTPFEFLTFNIKGGSGGEELALQVADYFWEKKEDSLKVGDMESFVPYERIQTFWQRSWVPLDTISHRIDRRHLASLVFLARNGQGSFCISDVAFTRSRDVAIPRSSRKTVLRPVVQKGMWIWNTQKLLEEKDAQARAVSFCVENGITDVFLQLPLVGEAKKEGIPPWDETGIRVLISLFHGKKIKVHALDGDPRFALKEWHGHVLQTIRSVIRFNQAAPGSEGFDGIRYDIEPYLLPGFHGILKKEILAQYLDLLRRAKEETRTAAIEFGVDIPFWYDEKDSFFEPVAEIKGRPLTEWILDIVDNVGIMDYRTQVFGADGILVHSRKELEYASKKGKKVFIGLETMELPDETLVELERGDTVPGIQILQSEKNSVIFRYLPGGKEPAQKNAPSFSQKKRTFVPSGKLTFAQKGEEAFEKAMESAKSELSRFPGFAGFAIHYYESYRLGPSPPYSS